MTVILLSREVSLTLAGFSVALFMIWSNWRFGLRIHERALESQQIESPGGNPAIHIAGEALYEAKSLTQPLAKETIWQSIEPKYIKEYLETDCKR